MAKQNNKAISDEEIIAALLQSGTQRAAAAALGIDERTLYSRMNNGQFKALYKAAKADVLRDAVTTLNTQLSDAIIVICEIMKGKEYPPAVRLQAAQTFLTQAGKFADRLNEAEDRAEHQRRSVFPFEY